MIPCGGCTTPMRQLPLFFAATRGRLFVMNAKFRIEQYERCETMNTGSIEDHLIGITKPSIDRMLKMENPADCIALYTFYCYTRKWQKNNAVFATSEFAMKALSWGRDKFSKAKTQLKEAGFIEDIQRKDSSGKIIGWFVGVRFAQSATLGNFHTTEIPYCGESADKYLGMVNKIPSNGKEIQAEAETSAMASDSEDGLVSPKVSPKEGTDVNANAESGKSDDLISRPPSGVKAHTTRKRKIPPPTTIPTELDCRDFRDAWSDFLTHRKEKRKPVTPTNERALLSKLREWGESRATEALRASVMNGWIGVFKPKEDEWRPTTI